MYDLIVCNPPYFTHSLKSSDPKRTIARHNDSLPHEEIMKGVSKLLKPDGIFAVILPVKEGKQMIENSISHQLNVRRILNVQSYPGKEPHRMLIEFTKYKRAYTENTLCIEKADRSDYSDDYKDLTQDFYLNF